MDEKLLADKLQNANFQQQLSKAEEKGGQVAQQSADVGSAKKQQDADKKVSTNLILARSNTTTAVPCKDAKGGFGECTKAA